MSCYQDFRAGDQISYRVRKARAKNGGYTVFTATVIEYRAGIESVLAFNHALGQNDLVPCESITMHQPTLLAS